jgi:hypothetical protein
MYYLKITGFIPENKQLEFEQTISFVSLKMPESCTGFDTSKDITDNENYQFMAYWDRLSSLQSFTRSKICLIILGAFRTLGKLKEKKSGEMLELS